MASFHGSVTLYDLTLISPNVFTNYKSVIAIHGDFGLAGFYFVPDGEPLGTNAKREGENVFDVYVHMSSWPAYVNMLHHEKDLTFFYNDDDNTAQLRSELRAPKS